MSKRKRWHAKIAIKLKDGSPKAAIIGSSNLTRPAYSEGYSAFNNECDVVLWVDEPSANEHFRPTPDDFDAKMGDDYLFSPIYSLLDERFKDQPKVDQRLIALYKEIMNRDDLEGVGE
jgi:hypothetical protein